MMMKRKNILAILALSVCCCISVGLMAGCKDDADNSSNNSESSIIESQETLNFKRTVVSVLVYETVALSIEENYGMDELTWKSSDEAIATVENGVVITKAVGTVTITVSKGELSDECVITVRDDSVIPAVSLNVADNKVSLYQDLTYALQPTLSYNGKLVDSFTVEFESEDVNIATIDEKGLISGVGLGKTNILISIKWNTFELNEIVEVEVKTEKYIQLNKSEIELYLVEDEELGLMMKDNVLASFYGLNGPIEGVSFTAREVGDNNGLVATCDNQGLVSAIGLGTTVFEFVCEYEGKTYVSSPVEVSVNKYRKTLKQSIYATFNTEGIEVDINDVKPCSALDSITLNGTTQAVEGTAFSASVDSTGEYEVIFATSDEVAFEYKARLVVADKVINNKDDLSSLLNDGYNVLAANIDCGGEALVLGNFDGVLDGDGHTISNVLNGNSWAGIFGVLGSESVIKNIGFYNIASSRQDQYNFALAGTAAGRIENVSFYQNGSGYIGAIFNKIEEGCEVDGLVVYAPKAKISGFFNSGLPSTFAVKDNIYIFANIVNANSNNTATATFLTGESGTDYLTSDEYKALDFTTVFDCSDNGYWAISEDAGVPMIGAKVLEVQRYEGAAQTYADADIVFDIPFGNIASVEIAGIALTSNAYEISKNSLTIKSTYLATLKNYKNMLIVKSSDEMKVYNAEIIKYTYISTFAELSAIAKTSTSADTPLAGYYILTADIDCQSQELYIHTLTGVIDGNGHTISNAKVKNTSYGSMISYIQAGAVVKNINFYNVTVVRNQATNVFGLVYGLYGTIENVSFHQNANYKMQSTIGIVYDGCVVKNFVVYAPNVGTSGFFSSGSDVNIFDETNIYIVTNAITVNSTKATTAVFLTGETGMDYLTTEEFTAIDFTTIFDCSENGMWKIDATLGIPLVKKD